MKSLEDLLRAIESNDPRTQDQHGQLSTDLPTFGGEEPESTLQVWSWDARRLLVTNEIGELEIVERKNWRG